VLWLCLESWSRSRLRLVHARFAKFGGAFRKSMFAADTLLARDRCIIHLVDLILGKSPRACVTLCILARSLLRDINQADTPTTPEHSDNRYKHGADAPGKQEVQVESRGKLLFASVVCVDGRNASAKQGDRDDRKCKTERRDSGTRVWQSGKIEAGQNRSQLKIKNSAPTRSLRLPATRLTTYL